MKTDGNTEEMKETADLFAKIAGEHTKIEVQPLKDSSVPALLTISEESRRMDDMMKMYAMQGENSGSFPLEAKLILNNASPLIQKVEKTIPEDAEKAEMIARHIYNLCLISQRKLSAEELKEFLGESYNLLNIL